LLSPTERETDYLAEHYHFHPLALDDCLSHKQLPKLDVFPGYLFFIFHFPFYDKKTRISTSGNGLPLSVKTILSRYTRRTEDFKRPVPGLPGK
jgi:Mg2+ and Co2+ transporter CorA